MTMVQDAHGFEWDPGNRDKNWVKHKVSNEECEEAFFDPHKRILETGKEVGREKRRLLVASTQSGRLLFVVFVIRNGKVRVISARDLNKRERGLYEKET